jgi:hypothetical protein
MESPSRPKPRKAYPECFITTKQLDYPPKQTQIPTPVLSNKWFRSSTFSIAEDNESHFQTTTRSTFVPLQREEVKKNPIHSKDLQVSHFTLAEDEQRDLVTTQRREFVPHKVLKNNRPDKDRQWWYSSQFMLGTRDDSYIPEMESAQPPPPQPHTQLYPHSQPRKQSQPTPQQPQQPLSQEISNTQQQYYFHPDPQSHDQNNHQYPPPEHLQGDHHHFQSVPHSQQPPRPSTPPPVPIPEPLTPVPSSPSPSQSQQSQPINSTSNQRKLSNASLNKPLFVPSKETPRPNNIRPPRENIPSSSRVFNIPPPSTALYTPPPPPPPPPKESSSLSSPSTAPPRLSLSSLSNNYQNYANNINQKSSRKGITPTSIPHKILHTPSNHPHPHSHSSHSVLVVDRPVNYSAYPLSTRSIDRSFFFDGN